MADQDDIVIRAANTLDRLQKEATKRVLAAYRFESNTVRGSVIELTGFTSLGEHEIAVRFELNGEKFEKTFPIPGVDRIAAWDRVKAFNKLVDCVSEEVTKMVKEQALHSFGEKIVQSPAFAGRTGR